MAGEIASAFVRIRPETQGFQQEAEGGIKRSLISIGKLAGGIFAVRELEQGVRHVAEAAVSQQEELAVVRNAVRDNNAAWIVHGRTVEEVLRKMAVKFGFTVADLAQGFTRIEVGTKDTSKSLSLLDVAMDVSRARHLGLAQASVVLARASEGNDTSLRRLGITIPKLSSNVDALKRQHLEAAAAGIKFDAQSKLGYQTALTQAKALDVQANKTRIVTELEKRFGGQSAAFAATAAGKFQTFHEAVNEFEVSLGNAFLPTLAAATGGLAREFQAAADSEGIHHAAAAAAREFAAGYHLVKGAIDAVLPGLRSVGHAVEEVTHVTGVGGILAIVAGYKSLAVAQGLSAAVQARYNKIVAAGRGELAATEATAAEAQAAQTAALEANNVVLVQHAAALNAHAAAVARQIEVERGFAASTEGDVAALTTETAALTANTEAFVANGAVAGRASALRAAVAAGGVPLGNGARNVRAADTVAAEAGQAGAAGATNANTLALVANTSSTVGAVEREAGAFRDAEGAAGALTTRIGTLGRGLFALAGGWTTVVSVALGGLAFGIYKIVTAESAFERENDRVSDSLHGLDAALTTTTEVSQKYRDTVSSIRSDRIAVASARLNVHLAEQALNTTKLSHASLGYQQLVQQLAEAIDGLRTSERQLGQDEQRAAEQVAKRRSEEQKAIVFRAAAVKEIIALEKEANAARVGGKQTAIEREIESVQRERAAAAQQAGHLTGPARDAELERVHALDRALAQLQRNRIAAHFDTSAISAGQFARALEHDADSLSRGSSPLRTQIQLLATFTRVLGHLPSVRSIRVILDAHTAEGAIAGLVRETARLNPTVQGFVQEIHREITALSSSNPIIARRLVLLADFAKLVHRIPNRHETELVLHAPNFQAAVKALSTVLAGMRGLAGSEGFASGQAFAQFFAQGELSRSGPLFAVIQSVLRDARSAHRTAAGISDVSKAEITAARATEQAARSTLARVAQNVRSAAETLQSAKDELVSSNDSLAEAIRSGSQQVKDAIVSADQNLFSIGSSLSDAIDQFIDAQNKSTDVLILGSPQAREARRLRDEIRKGNDSDEILRRTHALANQLEAQQTVGHEDAEKRKERIRREIADLIDEFNKGSITLREFNRRIAALLAREHVSYRAAGRILGIAFADGFEGAVKGLSAQAAAIAQFPRRGRTGLEPNIIRPIETLRATQREIAQAQKQRDNAALAVAKDQKELQKDEAARSRARNALDRATNRLDALNERHLNFLKEKAQEESVKEQRRHKELMDAEHTHTRLLRRIANEGIGQRKPPDPQPRRGSGRRGDGGRSLSALAQTMRGVAP